MWVPLLANEMVREFVSHRTVPPAEARGGSPGLLSDDALEGTLEAYQDLGFHCWPVDEVGLLVDHDRLGDGGHARASRRLGTWAECLQRLV